MLSLQTGRYPPLVLLLVDSLPPNFGCVRAVVGAENPLVPHPTWLLIPIPLGLGAISEGKDEADRIFSTKRKTRCDPTLPRCLPCERSGSVCEYFDTTRNKKINRNYVVHLQQKVRQLEAELSQYTDDDNDHPESAEDIVRPGGLVKLSESDETPRYLGPSSGIAMTRLLMDQAKRYTDSQRISELFPDVRARRMDRFDRMQSIVHMGASVSGPSGMAAKKKNFPMVSEIPAQTLPARQVADKLVEVFNSRGKHRT
jgi:hypothetical protein